MIYAGECPNCLEPVKTVSDHWVEIDPAGGKDFYCEPKRVVQRSTTETKENKMNPDYIVPSPSDPHRVYLLKFLINCTGMSIPDAQQAYEMVKATQHITGEPKALFKKAIKTFVAGKIFIG